jgi:alpha-glucosidase
MMALVWIVLCSTSQLYGQTYESIITFERGEYWWGGVVAFGSQMPYLKPVKEFDLALQNNNNQVVPLFVSNRGRYVWSDQPFRFEIDNNALKIKSEYEHVACHREGKTLKDAYLAACREYFPPTGLLPDQLLFSMPQYNTWIELMYDQNEKDILRYAQSVVDNGFPKGVLMIDDNWQKYYGNFDFKPEKFPDPKGMVEKLHEIGFKVMLWVCPFVSPDSPEYRDLAAKGYLIRKKRSNSPAVISWWNGQSACYDLTNPQAFAYFVSALKKVQADYGVDGFKFDAGDNSFYHPKFIDSYEKDALPTDHTFAWAKVGVEFSFNEYRAGWKGGGLPLVQRLGDKDYSWKALQLLIPEMIAAGLLGHAYSCPDMIGGGQISSFLNLDIKKIDERLIVRWAQVHALMPMMQFSVAPWRILEKEHLFMVGNMAQLHEKFGTYITECANQSSQTGEPIIRHLEYAFPNEGFSECNDQFMLGEKYLVAPVITPENKRTVKLPKGKWCDDQGKIYNGGKIIVVNVPLERLLYFEKL